ncbi:putative MC family transporter [Cardiosporidium cionae]|uniref:MC family transporter n=1 Tax=Cardiosporidium cionae TaxID=476202 RepID=A0ABQ7J9E8_9APIC|nr:putative MC family transporter [Cardiosporidium cionae]|eukprot:KAF8820625.1 putative MC family transporter [Cardiosporidium cionae]
MSPPPSSGKASWKDLMNGGILQCAEAATLGMPFEVWKTRMGRFRNENTLQSFVNVYKRGGVFSYWQGLSPKLVESATKGAVLLYTKEGILRFMRSFEFNETLSGFAAGAGGGICQTVVMSPCTFLVTAAVTSNDKNVSIIQKSIEVWKRHGIRGFYPGASAIAFRQATNWASRQGFTEFIRTRLKISLHKDKNAKLTIPQEALAGILGGALSTWNQPFEVARIYMQSAANEGKPKQNIVRVFSTIIKEEGSSALFKGIIPRMCLGIWQTLFMVTGAKLIQEYLPW